MAAFVKATCALPPLLSRTFTSLSTLTDSHTFLSLPFVLDRSLMSTSIQAQAAVLFFDTTSRVTYKNIPKWHADVSRICPDATFVLVRAFPNVVYF